jgi:hypothetical protein
MRRSWNDTSEILVVVASPMQKSEKRSDVGAAVRVADVAESDN